MSCCCRALTPDRTTWPIDRTLASGSVLGPAMWPKSASLVRRVPPAFQKGTSSHGQDDETDGVPHTARQDPAEVLGIDAVSLAEVGEIGVAGSSPKTTPTRVVIALVSSFTADRFRVDVADGAPGYSQSQIGIFKWNEDCFTVPVPPLGLCH